LLDHGLYVLIKLSLLIAFVIMVAGDTASIAQTAKTEHSQTASSTPTKQDPLATLNAAFHQAYRHDLEESLQRTSPIILVEGGKLVLLKFGKREEAEFIPANWDTLKEIDHGPLALFVLLNLHTDTTFDKSIIESLQNFQQLFQKAKAGLSQYNLSADKAVRQEQIADKSITFIRQILAKNMVTKNELNSFTGELTPLLMQNVDDDIAMELSRVDEIVGRWQKQMTASEWQSLYAVIESGHMPRKQETLSQYFALLLNEPHEGHRWIYAENVASEKEALDLLAKHIVDATIGESFFGDPMRMHRDLLGDAAKQYLIAHPPLESVRK
jgi:hypothetical protein